MLLRIPFMLLLLFFCQSAQAASWREDLREIDAKRDVLFKEQQPGFVIRPSSEQSAAIVGGHSKHGINYKRVATLEDRKCAYESMMRTAVMHSRTHFFEQNYALTPVTDDRYYGHLTACYIVDTATQLLEGPNGITTVSALAQSLNTYFQRMLGYKDTALRTLVDETVATKVLGVLGRYTQADYQALLTDKFVAWYQDVTASYPQDRAKYGIKMDVLPPPPSEKQVLDISFSDGRFATYDGSGLSFRGPVSMQGDFRSNPQEIVWGGLYINRSLPMQTLQTTLQRAPGVSRVGLRSEKVGLETLYARVIPPLVEKISSAPCIEDLKAALAISDVYRLFGEKQATENDCVVENLLGVKLLDMISEQVLPHEKVLVSFHEALEILEHCAQSKHAIIQKKACDNLKVGLHAYGHYLNRYSLNEEGLSLDSRIAFSKRSLELFKEAHSKGHPGAENSLSLVKNNLGHFYLEKATDTTLTYEEKRSLFEESLIFFREAVSSGYKLSQKGLMTALNNYGCYLLSYSASRPLDERILLLRKARDFLIEAEANGSKVAQQQNLPQCENDLGAILGDKASDVALLREEKIKLFEESITLLRHAAKQSHELSKTNLGAVLTSYGCYLTCTMDTDLPLDKAQPVLEKAIALFKEAMKLGCFPAECNLAYTENRLGLMLVKKASTFRIDSQKKSLCEQSLALFAHAATLQTAEVSIRDEIKGNLARIRALIRSL